MSGRVLIVDDDPVVRRLLSCHLQSAGLVTGVADSGEQMGLALVSAPWDAFVLDVDLPDADGLDLARRLRGCTDLPILLISSSAEHEKRHRLAPCGADEFLPKPFDPVTVVAHLQRLIAAAAIRRCARRPGSSAPPA